MENAYGERDVVPKMTAERLQEEKVRLAGWTAGATEKDKDTNPHRGKKNADELNWDLAWEVGNSGGDFTAW
ncbi:hypothetical protein WH87_05070 [Devosia epidermidihirudinis]|uniref:Uncharacterized protein n=2 Tax=Devosia epidermidihirudinis TaxID=1293439 RepID=A0A0F5QF08_9HYPH|nr:hypothetical protein WH87_05070 [Devosia epidermidihirudinis]